MFISSLINNFKCNHDLNVVAKQGSGFRVDRLCQIHLQVCPLLSLIVYEIVDFHYSIPVALYFVTERHNNHYVFKCCSYKIKCCSNL